MVKQHFLALSCAALICGALALLSACATQPPIEEQVEPQQTIWPLPPEPKRYSYLGSFQSLENLAEESQLSLRDLLLGKDESEENRYLRKPLAVHSDGQGRLFVADTGIPGLVVFEMESGKVSFWGTGGLGTLKKAVGVTAEAGGPIYVSDAGTNRIVVFDTNGNYLNAFGGIKELPGPAGIAFSEAAKRLYVVDVNRHQVLVYRPEGVLDSVIGRQGSGQGQFNFPTDLAIDSEGRLYVADTMNFRVQVLEASGAFVRTFGTVGDKPGNFNRLKGIGVDSDGNIYAVDASYNNFQVFDPEGRLLIFVGGAGTGPGQFYLPAGLHIDAEDRVFIADQYNHRVQMFQYFSDRGQ